MNRLPGKPGAGHAFPLLHQNLEPVFTLDPDRLVVLALDARSADGAGQGDPSPIIGIDTGQRAVELVVSLAEDDAGWKPRSLDTGRSHHL